MSSPDHDGTFCPTPEPSRRIRIPRADLADDANLGAELRKRAEDILNVRGKATASLYSRQPSLPRSNPQIAVREASTYSAATSSVWAGAITRRVLC